MSHEERRETMGKAFMFQGKTLCEDCYKKAIDYETLAGRKIPPKKMVEAGSCAKCKVILEPEEEL
jgi:hypothetical protein